MDFLNDFFPSYTYDTGHKPYWSEKGPNSPQKCLDFSDDFQAHMLLFRFEDIGMLYPDSSFRAPIAWRTWRYISWLDFVDFSLDDCFSAEQWSNLKATKSTSKLEQSGKNQKQIFMRWKVACSKRIYDYSDTHRDGF